MGRRLGGTGRVWAHDESGEAHSFDPGDEVPKWAAKKITNPKAWGDSDDDGDASTDATPATPPATGDDVDTKTDPARDDQSAADDVKPYPKWKKAELEAEVARRNEGRDADDLIEVDGKGTVADLAAALEGDDVAQADA